MPDRVILKGQVVRLEPLEPSHVDPLVRAASEDHSTYGYTFVPATTSEMSAYVAAALEDEDAGWALPFVIRLAADQRVVGSTRFLDLDYWTGQGAPSVAEIGSTWLAASAQRTRVNTETKLLMLRHAFDDWEVARVTLKTDARNGRSRRAIERIGARFEGVRRAHVLATDGSIRDSAYFSIVSEEWPAVRDNLMTLLGRSHD